MHDQCSSLVCKTANHLLEPNQMDKTFSQSFWENDSEKTRDGKKKPLNLSAKAFHKATILQGLLDLPSDWLFFGAYTAVPRDGIWALNRPQIYCGETWNRWWISTAECSSHNPIFHQTNLALQMDQCSHAAEFSPLSSPPPFLREENLKECSN